MDRKFLTDTENGLSTCSKSIRDFLTDRWDEIEDFEKSSGKSMDEVLSKEDYIALFDSFGIRRSSSFRQYKMAIVRYLSYQIAHGVLPKGQDQIVSSIVLDDLSVESGDEAQYIKNIATLKACIDDTISGALNYDDTLFDAPISALYLAWFGFTLEQMAELRKDEVKDNGVMKGDELIELPDYAMRIIHRYRDSDGYQQQARGLIFRRYQASDYLFRSERSYKLSRDNMMHMFTRFNQMSGNVYSLRYNIVHLSGVFRRVYELECDSADFNLSSADYASKVFEEPLSGLKLKHMVNDYEHYKKLFK